MPDDVDGLDIDRAVRAELRTLTKENAKGVGAHLIMVARLLDEDLDAARAHADAAVRRAGRVPSVREARGMVAYMEGDWNVALAEFRTARRLSGSHHLLPYLIDCERALGRNEKALELAQSEEVDTLGASERVEVAIVVSGIRRDLGQPEAALHALEGRHLVPGRPEPWAPRLYYAYAEALLELGRVEDARTWFHAAADVDGDLQTDAWERLDELDGTVLIDLGDEDEADVDSGPDSQAREGDEGGLPADSADDTDPTFSTHTAEPERPAGAGGSDGRGRPSSQGEAGPADVLSADDSATTSDEDVDGEGGVAGDDENDRPDDRERERS